MQKVFRNYLHLYFTVMQCYCTRRRKEKGEYKEHHLTKKPKVYSKHFFFNSLRKRSLNKHKREYTQLRLKKIRYFQSLFRPVCQCFFGVMFMCNAVNKKGSDSPCSLLPQTLISEKSPIKPEGQHTVQITTRDTGQHEWELRERFRGELHLSNQESLFLTFFFPLVLAQDCGQYFSLSR